MPAVGGTALPTLSQIQSWSTAHLIDAATHWTTTAHLWENTFSEAVIQIHSPGGTPWTGSAAEQAQARTISDRVAVSVITESLHEAAAVATVGAEDIAFAKRAAIETINVATSQGFTVTEDLSVTDSQFTGSPAAIALRQAFAQALSADIRSAAATLMATDTQVATQLTAATAGIADSPPGTDPGTIQLVDFPTAPAPPVPPDPQPGPQQPVHDGDDVRRILDPLQNGGKRGVNDVGKNPGVKEVWDESSMRRLWDQLTRNAVDSTQSGYDGNVRELPDGTKIGFRDSGKGWGDTLDVWYPDGTNGKVHTPYAPYFPTINEPPVLPPLNHPASPLPQLPPQVGHAPVQLPPSGIFDPNGLPPWLQDPSAPGFHTPVLPPMIAPGEILASPSGSGVYSEPAGPSIMSQIGESAQEVTEGLVVAGLVGLAVLGGLAGVTQPGGVPG